MARDALKSLGRDEDDAERIVDTIRQTRAIRVRAEDLT